MDLIYDHCFSFPLETTSCVPLGVLGNLLFLAITVDTYSQGWATVLLYTSSTVAFMTISLELSKSCDFKEFGLVSHTIPVTPNIGNSNQEINSGHVFALRVVHHYQSNT